MTDFAVYVGLFFAALAAATILPMQSEAVLAGLLVLDSHPVWLLVGVASVGDVLGSVVNWGLGCGIERFRDRTWFPANARTLERATLWYRRYGKWSLLLSWLPIVGDPLTVVAGVLREPFGMFLLFVTIAKVTRYLALSWQFKCGKIVICAAVVLGCRPRICLMLLKNHSTRLRGRLTFSRMLALDMRSATHVISPVSEEY